MKAKPPAGKFKPGGFRAFTALLTAAVFLLSTVCVAYGDSNQDRRLRTGLKLFRAMIGADLDLEGKAGSGKNLTLIFLYHDDRQKAEKLAEQTLTGSGGGKSAAIKGILAKAEVISTNDLKSYSGPVAGLFIAERLNDSELHEVISFSLARKIIFYSPFEGDVERGILGGLSIEAKVRPYINEEALDKSGVRIKPFFLRVTKVFK